MLETRGKELVHGITRVLEGGMEDLQWKATGGALVFRLLTFAHFAGLLHHVKFWSTKVSVMLDILAGVDKDKE